MKRRHQMSKKMGEEGLQATINGSQTKGGLKGALGHGVRILGVKYQKQIKETSHYYI
jgi:hypothetical protein